MGPINDSGYSSDSLPCSTESILHLTAATGSAVQPCGESICPHSHIHTDLWQEPRSHLQGCALHTSCLLWLPPSSVSPCSTEKSTGIGKLDCQMTDEDETRSVSSVAWKCRWSWGSLWLLWRCARPRRPSGMVWHLHNPELFLSATQRGVAAAKLGAGNGLWLIPSPRLSGNGPRRC